MRLHPYSLLTGLFAAFRQIGSFVVFAVVATLLRGDTPGRDFGFFAWAVGAGLVLSVLSAALRYVSTVYHVTDREVLLDTGIFWKQHRVVPRDRIQEVHLSQNLLQRALGIMTVKIESASGGKAEIELESLGEAEAHELRNALTGALGVSFYVKPDPPAYEAGIQRIVFASMLENRALLLVAGLVGLAMPFIEDETVLRRLTSVLFDRGREVPPSTWLMLGAGVFFAGWVLSGLLGIWNFAGFRIERHPRGVQVVYGLGNRSQRVLRSERIQEATVAQGLLFRIFGLYAVRAKSAAVVAEREEAAGIGFLSPAATRGELPGLLALVFPGLEPLDQGDWRPLPGKSLVLRFVAAAFGWLILLGLGLAAWQLVPRAPAEIADSRVLGAVRQYGLPAFGCLAGLALVRTVLVARTERRRLSGTHLAFRVGGLTRRWQVLPANRMQMFEIGESPLQRLFGVCSTRLYVAAAGCSVDDIPPEEAARLRDEALAIRRADPRRGV